MPSETFLGKLKIKVTLEGHINELFWAITPTYVHGLKKCTGVLLKDWKCHLKHLFMHVHLPSPPFTPPAPPPPKKKKKFLSD